MVRVQLRVAVRPMALADVPQVSAIDREAFPTLWPPPAFKDELLHNKIARYLVIWEIDERHPAQPPPGAEAPDGEHEARAPAGAEGGLLSTVRRLLPSREPKELPPARLLGFVGIWFMADEAHVTTVAVREAYQRQGLGELLMIAALELARQRESRVATLEVRTSNLGAQALYEKYGFARVGVRPKYYTDNNEDAFIMTTDTLTSPAFEERLRLLKERFFASFPGGSTPPIVLK